MGWFKKSSPREESATPTPTPTPTSTSTRNQTPVNKGVTYLGKNLNINGSITGRDDVQIFGRHTGGIQLEGDIDIKESATTQGDLKARTIQVGGAAEGDLIASSKLHIQRTGRVKGNITAPVLVLKEGAVFNGEVNMHNR